MRGRDFPKKLWHFLARLNVAAIFILILLLLTALGSCFPQLSPSFTTDVQTFTLWQASARDRYGALTDMLTTLGIFEWFHQPVFVIALALLAAATLVCTLDRWRVTWHRALYQPVRCPDGVFNTGPYVARLTLPTSARRLDYLRETLQQHGFRVRSENAANAIYLRGDRHRLSPSAALVTHLATLLLLLGIILSRAYGWQETLTLGPDESVTLDHHNNLAIRNDSFSIILSTNGNVANYQANITILVEAQTATPHRVQINEPLNYQGIEFYLQGYDRTEENQNVSLLAVYDPGFEVVIAAGFLLLLGMTVSFNFPHAWLNARLDSDGSLKLAGWAERRAWDFGREFTTLTAELEQWAKSTPQEANDRQC